METHLRPSRLIVPVDDVRDRSVAVAVAVSIARRSHLDVEIVTVVDPEIEVTDPQPMIPSVDGVMISTTIIDSDSVERSLAEQAASGHGILCLASSGRTAVIESLTGSISASLLHHTKLPMIVVGPHCEPTISGSRLAIAVDGTPHGESIVGAALDLADLLGLVPMLYQVLPEGTQAMVGDARESSYVARLAERHQRPHKGIQYDVLHDGHVAHGLSRLTEDHDIAMIALSSHGHAPTERLLLPSIAHQLVRHSRCPVVIGPRRLPIPQFDHGKGKRVVVGIDGSPADFGAIAAAIEEADRRKARLEIVHAWSHSWAIVEGGVVVGGDFNADQRAAQVVLDRAVTTARGFFYDVNVTHWLAERLPMDALLEAAIGSELVVVGDHRDSRIERWLLGSTTEAMLQRSPVPVLVVPEQVRTETR